NGPCVLVRGIMARRSMLREPKGDQHLGMHNPMRMLSAPRRDEYIGLCEAGMPSQLLFYYLQRAAVEESDLMWHWLYVVWEAVGRLIPTGKLERQSFDYAFEQPLPWITG
ncbi:hypothetical protein AB4M04_26375, partial [Serratia quinivorans]